MEKDLEKPLLVEGGDLRVDSLRKTKLRWLALALGCLLMLGDEYCFDIPMAMEASLKSSLAIDTVYFNLLYTVYSIPNIVLPFFGGIIVDRLGVRLALFLFSGILMVGQGIVVAAGFLNNYWLMIFGRFVYGMGSESLLVSQNAVISMWFKSQELSFALGLNSSIPSVGSALNSFITPKLDDKYGVISVPLLFGLIISFGSFISGLLLILLDKRNSAIEKQSRTLFLSTMYEPTLIDEILEEEKFELKDVKHFTSTFWILLVVYMFGESLFVPFLYNANEMYQTRFSFSAVNAGDALVIPYTSAMLFTPFFGILIDKYGRRTKFILLAALMFTLTYLLFALLPTCQSQCMVALSPLFMLGLCVSLYDSAIMPSASVLIEEKMIGTAYGIISVFKNASLALFPVLVGFIQEDNGTGSEVNENSFVYTSLFFMGCSILLCINAVFLIYADKREGGVLERSKSKT